MRLQILCDVELCFPLPTCLSAESLMGGDDVIVKVALGLLTESHLPPPRALCLTLKPLMCCDLAQAFGPQGT